MDKAELRKVTLGTIGALIIGIGSAKLIRWALTTSDDEVAQEPEPEDEEGYLKVPEGRVETIGLSTDDSGQQSQESAEPNDDKTQSQPEPDDPDPAGDDDDPQEETETDGEGETESQDDE